MGMWMLVPSGGANAGPFRSHLPADAGLPAGPIFLSLASKPERICDRMDREIPCRAHALEP